MMLHRVSANTLHPCLWISPGIEQGESSNCVGNRPRTRISQNVAVVICKSGKNPNPHSLCSFQANEQRLPQGVLCIRKMLFGKFGWLTCIPAEPVATDILCSCETTFLSLVTTLEVSLMDRPKLCFTLCCGPKREPLALAFVLWAQFPLDTAGKVAICQRC